MNPKRHLASFTLVEMLVSIAVFSLLVLLIFGLMGGATKLWRQQTGEEQSFREARSALNALSHDMNGALISTNTYWFYCNGTNQLAFLTTLPDSAQGTTVASGDICAVGYSLEYSTNDSSGYQTNMSLYRYVRFSGPTYTNFIQNPNVNAVESIFVNPDGVNTVRQLIARDIPQISFASYTNNSSGVPTACLDSVTPVTLLTTNMLINVGITALNDRTAVNLTTQAQWQNTGSAAIQQNEEVFALRVRPQAP
jgi:type II secretory pathway pseudopilin PulG